MKVVGLTGGIATGVTTVARMLAERGAVVIEADRIAREVVEPGTEAYRRIVEAFGPQILQPDGRLDRRALARLVFADESARRRLNAITHPEIRRRIRDEVARVAQSRPDAVVVIDIPLLLDTTGPEAFDLDGVIVVSAPREEQIRRLMARDGLTREEAEQRVGAQRPVADKEAEADWVIHNAGSLDETRRQVDVLWQQLAG